MKYKDYIEFMNSHSGFSGREDSFFMQKYVLDEDSNLTAEQAFNMIDSLGKTPSVKKQHEDNLLLALKGKAAFNLKVKMTANDIKLFHKEDILWRKYDLNLLNKECIKAYKSYVKAYLVRDNEYDFHFEAAWKQAALFKK